VSKIGVRPLLLAGSAASTGGLYWLSRISEHATYTSRVLGPTIVIGAGTALLFVTLSLVALNRVAAQQPVPAVPRCAQASGQNSPDRHVLACNASPAHSRWDAGGGTTGARNRTTNNLTATTRYSTKRPASPTRTPRR
jgi:hypothetical protein